MSYNVRTFRAKSMPEALAAVKRELGSEAIILGTRYLPAEGLGGLARRQRVEITAAPPGAVSPAPRIGGASRGTQAAAPRAATPQATQRGARSPGVAADADRRAAEFVPADFPVLRPSTPAYTAQAAPAARTPESSLSPEQYNEYVRLVQNEVAEELAQDLVRKAGAARGVGAKAGDLRAALQALVAEMVPECPGIALTPGKAQRVALVGPPGAGKSTSIAKLAAEFAVRQQQRVVLLTLDKQRLGADVEMQRYAEALGVSWHAAQTTDEVQAALTAAEDADLLLIDTPGVGLREHGRFARLAQLLRAARPDELYLVLPASLDPQTQLRYANSFKPLSPRQLILTHLDDVVGFGVLLSVIRRLGLGIAYVSTGQNVPRDIEHTDRARLTQLIAADP